MNKTQSRLAVAIKDQFLSKIKSLNYYLIEECKRANEGSTLSKKLREQLDSLSREERREVVNRVRNGCAPLFIACKRGCVDIAEYLVTVCEANIEQRGLYELTEDRSLHVVTPIWCAAVSGKLPVVKYLVRIGCDINALSDSGSTPVRSACYMTHIDIVQFLVENGADVRKSNIHGGTCLINSVQSTKLCKYIIDKGVDINQKDIQNKTALHYAIQEHRLDTVILFLEKGADPFAKSRYGDDALQTACLKGTRNIFNYLISNIPYTDERLADAHELLGSTLLDEYDDPRSCILYWKLAHYIRTKYEGYISKRPKVPNRPAYEGMIEFTTYDEIETMITDLDTMKIQSLLICERVLGASHKDMLLRLMFRGASYAESLRFQKCIDLWKLALEIRIENFTILYADTCFSAEALVHLMLYDKFLVPGNLHVPLFSDVLAVFKLLTNDIIKSQELLQMRPIYRKQQENFDRALKCITHLIYLLIKTAKLNDEIKLLHRCVFELVSKNVRSACTNDTLLHLCVSRLNVVKSNFFTSHGDTKVVFPDIDVVRLLIKCGSDVNAKNESKSTPLHVIALPYNFDNNIVHLLLQSGADLDLPNKNDERPINLLTSNSLNGISLMNFISLKCLSATIISKYRIPYKNQVPKILEEFIKQHES